MTITGEFIGSPLYMSPEQIRGDVAGVDRRTDIYSLGATLYEWLTLRPPFPGETREQVITRILQGEMPEPRTINPQVPLDMETICLKALSKERGNRYSHASEMRDDLNRYLLRDQIRARRAGLIAKAMKHIGKRRVAAVLVLAIAIVAPVTALLIREKKENVVSEQIINTTQAQAQAAHQESVQLRRENQDIRDVVQELEMVRQRMEMGQEAAAAIRPMVAGLLQFGDLSSAYTPLTPTQRIGAAFLNSIRNAEVARLKDTDRSQIEDDSAQDHYLRDLAEVSAGAAVGHLNDCLGLEADHLPACRLRAWIHCQLGDGAAMLADAERIIVLSPNSSDGYLLRAVTRLILDDPAACLEDVERAAATTASDEWLPTVAGLALVALNRPDDALGRLSKALIVNPDNVTALLARADLTRREGHHQSAVVDLTRALELEPDNAEALEWRGDCYSALQRYQEAFDDFFKSARISGNTALTLKVITAALNRDNQRAAMEAPTAENASSADDSKNDPEPPPAETDPGQMHEWLKDFLDGQPHGARGLPKPQPSALNRLLPTR
jgi:tetratricopeptide (TPR) repeat protein